MENIGKKLGWQGHCYYHNASCHYSWLSTFMSFAESCSPSLRKRAFSAGTWSLFALVASQGIRFGGNLVMTRLLVPEMFGVMLIANTASVLLALLSDIGLKQNIIQSHRGDDPVFLNTAWTIQILRGFVLYALMLVLSGLVLAGQAGGLWATNSTYALPELPLVLAVTGLSAIFAGIQSTNIATAFRHFQQRKVVLAEIVSQLVGFALMLGLGWLTHSIWSLVAAGLITSAVNTALSHLWFDAPRNRLHWDRASIKELVAFGRWIMLSSIVGVLAAQADRILFGGSMSATELGVYSIAVLILGALETGMQRVTNAMVFPAFGEAARSGDAERMRTLYFRIRTLVDIPLLFLCGFLFVASPTIIGFLYDKRYAGAGDMLAVLSIALFFWRFTITHQAWLSLGLSRYQAVDNLIRFLTICTTVPFLLWLGGPSYALWGVALQALPTLILIFHVNRRLNLINIRYEAAVLPMLVIGAISGSLINLVNR